MGECLSSITLVCLMAGDHAYKMNPDVKPAEQMISALPDVQVRGVVC